jgi:hypothetical protein
MASANVTLLRYITASGGGSVNVHAEMLDGWDGCVKLRGAQSTFESAVCRLQFADAEVGAGGLGVLVGSLSDAGSAHGAAGARAGETALQRAYVTLEEVAVEAVAIVTA